MRLFAEAENKAETGVCGAVGRRMNSVLHTESADHLGIVECVSRK